MKSASPSRSVSSTPSALPATGASSVPARRVAEILQPVFAAASASSSLIASRHATKVAGRPVEIPKFLLLGQRGGGQPIRLALLGGVEDSGNTATTAALARLLVQLRANPGQARDYAVFAYPLVDGALATEPRPVLAPFAERLAQNRLDGDVLYFQNELQKWTFDGFLTLRQDAAAEGFYVRVRSAVIAQEVARPALEVLGRTAPVREASIEHRETTELFPETNESRSAKGRSPAPFELELVAPGLLPEEARIAGLVTLVLESLRHYRRLIAHAADL